MTAVMHALGSPRRRAILRLVWDRERAAGEIHRALGDVTFGAVSQQLSVLSKSGLVTCRSAGRTRLYLARKDDLGPLAAWLEASWSDALSRLKERAELEAARRGPRQRRQPRSTR
jgi:DNA-binding transcriptional ArsR family regulator